MDADALLHPRGPLPPGVYWRRRAVTLIGAVLVLLLGSRACGGGSEGRSGLEPSPSPSGTAAPRASGSPSASATAIGRCRPSNLVLNARADAQEYPAGRRPVLTIGIKNTGTVPCRYDVGQANREIRVLSGNDRVWSSDDCSPGGEPEQVTLRPGAAPTEFNVTWSRKRSAPGCPAGTRDAAPGTYRVVGRFGDLNSEPDTFSLR